MGIVRRVVEDEPEEKPNELGRALLRIARENPDQWMAVYESDNRARVVYFEGCLIGRAKGRIAGVTNIDGWEARVVEHDADKDHGDVVWFELRVRYSGPVQDGQQPLPVMESLRRGHNLEGA
jgi:hypothetical protein